MAKIGRVIRRSILCFLVLTLVAAVVLWLMVHAKPTEYIPDLQQSGEVQIARDAKEFDRVLTGDILSGLRQRKDISATFTDSSANAWMHRWLRANPDGLPEWISNPQVAFRPGRMVLMAKLRYGVIETVISADCSPAVDAEGKLSLHLTSLKAGVLPLPDSVMDMLMDQLDERISHLNRRTQTDAKREAEDEIRWLEGLRALLTGRTVDTAALPGLKRDGYLVRTINLEQGEITLRLLPQGTASGVPPWTSEAVPAP